MIAVIERILGVAAERSYKPGLRRFGVSGGGPWDPHAAKLSNAAVGNALDGPVWEVLNGTVKVSAQSLGSLAVYGQKVEIRRRARVESGSRRIVFEPGEVIEVRANVGYISISSKVLPTARFVDSIPNSLNKLRYLPSGTDLIEKSVTVSPKSSRMGIRLSGGTPSDLELPSEPTCPGAIQQTPGGEYIVIGPDGPTIGGYPKIGVVIEADLRILPYLSPSMAVTLHPVDWETAASARHAQLAQFMQEIKLIQIGIS